MAVTQDSHEYFMSIALDLARDALKNGEFPVGAILVYDNKIIARGMRTHSRGNAVSEIDHAEINAIKNWIENGKPFFGKKTIIYTTLEPCLMCLGAIYINNIDTIVYAVEDPMGGALKYINQIKNQENTYSLYNRNLEVIPNVLRSEALKLFYEFYQNDEKYLKNTYLANYLCHEYEKIRG